MSNILMESFAALNGHLQIEIWFDDFQHAVSGHPEVTIEKIRQTLKRPSRVVQSHSSNNVCLFYWVEIETIADRNLYFCIVIAVIANGKGRLVTAYDTDFIKTGITLFSEG